MINIAFRLLLSFNATSLLVIIFLVQNGYTLGHFFRHTQYSSWLADIPNILSFALYSSVPLLTTGVSILLSSGLGKDAFKQGDVSSVEHANNSFLPSYLGYFFVALSINSWDVLIYVYAVLFVFTFLSQALYFNPLFLIFGYEFYNITTKNGTAIFLISRYKYKKPDEIVISRAFRINDYTFIERGKANGSCVG